MNADFFPADDLLVDGTLEAAIYPRVSGGAQEDGYSLDTQQAAMLAKARELGWRVRRSNIFPETHTGEDLFEGPVLTRLRQRVAQGDIEAVLFYDVDLFARDPVWIEMVTQECFHFGAQVAFVRGGDDLSRDTPEARVLRMLKGCSGALRPTRRGPTEAVLHRTALRLPLCGCRPA